MKNLHDQVAIVTGAASGIGEELARQLSVAGCHLALIDVDEAGLDSLRDDLNDRRITISIHKADVADEQAVKSMVDDIIRIHQRISILINNAGISVNMPFEDAAFDDHDRVMRTNFWGPVHLCRYALPFLKKEREARIVNVLSGFAVLGFPNKTAYCSSKAALLGFSNAFYTEVYGTSVRVSMVFPPAVDTSLIRNERAYDDGKKQREVEFVARHGMPVEKVARKMIAGMLRGNFRIRIGPTMQVLDMLARGFPTMMHTWVARIKSRIGFV